jgi:hypothetical protein
MVSCPPTFPADTSYIHIECEASTESKLVTVTKVESRSDWFLVETSGGFPLLEWYGGTSPSQDQQFYGNVHKYGFVELTSKVGARTMKVWVDDYSLSKESALKKLAAKIKP